MNYVAVISRGDGGPEWVANSLHIGRYVRRVRCLLVPARRSDWVVVGPVVLVKYSCGRESELLEIEGRTTMPLRMIRTREIRLMWDGNKICALAGDDLQAGVGGFGDDVPEALIDLANRIRGEETTIPIVMSLLL
jgi:hypothetical protein